MRSPRENTPGCRALRTFPSFAERRGTAARVTRCMYFRNVRLFMRSVYTVYIDTRCMPSCIYKIHIGGRLQMPVLVVGIRACIRSASSVPASWIFNASATGTASLPPALQYFAIFHGNHYFTATSDALHMKLRCQLIIWQIDDSNRIPLLRNQLQINALLRK